MVISEVVGSLVVLVASRGESRPRSWGHAAASEVLGGCFPVGDPDGECVPGAGPFCAYYKQVRGDDAAGVATCMKPSNGTIKWSSLNCHD